MKNLIIILYTTQYRKGGQQFQKVAETLAADKQQAANEVWCRAIESKEEVKVVFREVETAGRKLSEFHFVGHSGMYGPMYGTVDYPEQFSPYELANLQIPFTNEAVAYFHCCRSARWFAPYFARVQQVKTGGYHWYTAFSSRRDRFKLPLKRAEKLYCIGCPGKQSHGMFASFKKYAGLMPAESMKFFAPETDQIDDTYNAVAGLYASTFQDIKVRRDEFQYLMDHLPSDKNVRLLDIGCGNGALLKELSIRIETGIGVDVSENLLQEARTAHRALGNLSFEKINGPSLPFEEDTFDVVTSLLSFRYLDWDPIMLEIERVLKREGKLIIIDMVTAPVQWKEWPAFFKGKFSHYRDRSRHPEFHQNLTRLVNHPDWKHMLKYNPIRSQHEMKWYLESRFPGRKVEVINVGMHSRILAFDSGDMKRLNNIELTYP